MDIQQIATTAVTVALSVGAVSAFVIKWAGKLEKYVKIAKDATALADDLVEALKDGQVTPEEIAKFSGDLVIIKKDIAS